MYASIRQGKAKPGMAAELTRRIKEGARFRSSVMWRASRIVPVPVEIGAAGAIG